MKKILLFILLAISINANDTYIWNQEEKPSLENNFQQNKKTYQTNSIGEAVGVTLIESIYQYDKITEKKKLNDDFKYLDEFDKSIK